VSRVLVIGLDGLSPGYVDEWLADLPNLATLMQRGIYGPLQSIIQPATPPAWTAMLSGRDPSHFGFTDFTYRVGNSYTDFRLVHSRLIRVPTLYTLLPEAGLRAVLAGVPVTYPPVTIPGGACLSCFMAPSLRSSITDPPSLQPELLAQTSSPYLLDVSVDDAGAKVDWADLLRRLRELDRQRFDVARYMLRNKPWDLFFMVAMGTDRIGHYCLRFQDPGHARYQSDGPYHGAVREHYRYCDSRIGELLDLTGPDTVVLVVSDHGIQPLAGRVNLNDWLAAKGFLHLADGVSSPTPLGRATVDWPRTRAWAQGFGGQIYLNVKGREPLGCLDPGEVGAALDEIAGALGALTGPSGERLPVEVIRRRHIYRGPHADRCPDLYVQVDVLRYLTTDRVGHPKLVNPVDELGCDDGSHAPAGFFALAGPGVPTLGRFNALHLLDVAPTVLDLLGVPIPADLEGRPIHRADDVYSDEEEAELTSRLQTLYLK
jgi:predicted AlkP superfamily phosphohydrolase/phosphomutase